MARCTPSVSPRRGVSTRAAWIIKWASASGSRDIPVSARTRSLSTSAWRTMRVCHWVLSRLSMDLLATACSNTVHCWRNSFQKRRVSSLAPKVLSSASSCSMFFTTWSRMAGLRCASDSLPLRALAARPRWDCRVWIVRLSATTASRPDASCRAKAALPHACWKYSPVGSATISKARMPSNKNFADRRMWLRNCMVYTQFCYCKEKKHYTNWRMSAKGQEAASVCCVQVGCGSHCAAHWARSCAGMGRAMP